ncbi:MAG: transketolase [Armatimonadetes bacterium CG_4_10_14_3_um_filter_66_18]|nr:transketolase family protein [Armatimonadota bacterium]OIP05311.1 MAG: transketolase [Armatimonadetes bacterium CG2_30_66_41]PIU88484.1 MAG: transketolase [Armatimonadetes bacterium CG06_land_8_20_14_3_00_66_21]PIX37642.1 MAG: transketolase [Armatimonadetes bacterium CG_4_8_14_3_um_filter_66_20]PIY38068.1 MAG: transketolase [Armatimonadetes bacterium CG_4_10_14_3_um_filter_66_18]PIZ35279.1 MAG: transketolase [Armatimonadetes bacterium CG_4_10_14_0_8_um_filter_66_14]PJB60275.1 MAG: transket
MKLQQGNSTREAYGQTLAEVGRTNPDIVVLDADLSKSTMAKYFAAEFPDRFFNVGIAEANMVGLAAGLATCGKIPFCSSFACFVMCKAFDQLRLAVAYSELNVKIVGSHGGISIGEDGVSQMSVEDIALGGLLPGFSVIVPADEPITRKAVPVIAAHSGPVYMRVGRPKVPVVYTDEAACSFEIGKANQLRQGGDVTIIANGLLVAPALDAADRLAAKGIETRVLDMHTVKPLDDAAVAAAASETNGIVVAEEHLLYGGLGSTVAMSVARQHPAPMRFVGLDDMYAESGTPEGLIKKYGLTADSIEREVNDLLRA